MNLVQVSFQLECEARPIKAIQLRAFFFENRESGFFQEIHLTVFAVSVTKPTHPAQEVAKRNECDQRTLAGGAAGIMVGRYHLHQIGCEMPAFSHNAAALRMVHAKNSLFGFVQGNVFGGCPFYGALP